MNYSDKQILFEGFEREWGIKFELAKSIVAWFGEAKALVERLGTLRVVTEDELAESQLEWIALLNQLENPIDTGFFKAHWVPLSKDDYDYFIDLSVIGCPLIRVQYFSYNPYRWESEVLVQHTSLLMFDGDASTIDVDAVLNPNKPKELSPAEKQALKQKRKGLLGQLDPLPLDKSSLFTGNGIDSVASLDADCLRLTQVSPLAIGLLPEELKIRVLGFYGNFEEDFENEALTQTVKGMHYLVEHTGPKLIDFYDVSLVGEANCSATWGGGNFTVRHHDRELLELVHERFRCICHALQ
ncbi:hypothetical protein [Mangrovibacterium marinum]|uniref:hypothetical protein n=1 Tax=Mangrovibacterium marinum TaxID=1639118 RepID=UPI002A18A1BF|nr:hypothetical protein [Mangrovibacterium marinum]